MVGKELLEYLGATPLVLAVLIGFWKGDDALSIEFRRDISNYLKNRVFFDDQRVTPKIVLTVFDGFFGRSRFGGRFFIRSFSISVIVLFFLAIMVAKILDVATWEYIKIAFFAGLLANIVADYTCLLETRWIIKKLNKGDFSPAFSIVVDAVLTLAIFATCFGVWYIFADMVWKSLNLREIIPNAPSVLGEVNAHYFPGEKDFLYAFLVTLPAILTCFFSSTWLWAAIIGTRLAKTLPTLSYALPIDEKPIRSIGVLFSALCFVLTIPFAYL